MASSSTFISSAGAPVRRPGGLFWLDRVTEILLYAMVVFSPWAFGTTQAWAMGWMNAGGYALGVMMMLKAGLRRPGGRSPWLMTTLRVLTIFILGYVLLSAANAEFTYFPTEWRQEPRPYVEWLPHSLDRLASWRVFWNWLALAGVFWAVCDWLSGEVTPEGQPRARRLRRLVFVLAGNGALVALEGILQRFSGTPLLLWFQATHDNPTADAQFGPYAYRSNAAQFFNLLWPVALGWWWINQSRRREREREQGHQWLLPCVMLLVAGALVSMSRAGVAVALLQMGAAVLILLAGGAAGWRVRLSIVLVFAATLGAAFYFGWEQLAQRLVTASSDPLAGRTETYHLAARMTVDYPWFGVGPGAFDSVFQLYRNSPGDYWPAQLHNDWLEYLITFGRVGGALLLGAVALLAGRWFTPGGLRLPWTFVALIWVALLGCLLHARFDFPLQIYSIQFVCVLMGAILFSGSQRGG